MQESHLVLSNINCNFCENIFKEEKELQVHMDEYHTEKTRRNTRKFNYNMNEKKANAKILKGAMRESHLNLEIKSTCVNMRFSDGSYHKIVLPLLREWSQLVHKTINIDGKEFKIIESNIGTDISENHIDTKFVLMFNGNRVVVHVYNGTQNLMVQGRNFVDIAVNQLQPFFTKKIEESIDVIESINEEIKEKLGNRKIRFIQDLLLILPGFPPVRHI